MKKIKEIMNTIVSKVKSVIETAKLYVQIGMVMIQSAVTGVSPERIIFKNSLAKLGL